jgi:hypothetical protein
VGKLCSGHWIERNEPLPWPPLSTDLTLFDFIVWGIWKIKFTERQTLCQKVCDNALLQRAESIKTCSQKNTSKHDRATLKMHHVGHLSKYLFTECMYKIKDLLSLCPLRKKCSFCLKHFLVSSKTSEKIEWFRLNALLCIFRFIPSVLFAHCRRISELITIADTCKYKSCLFKGENSE